VFGRLRNYKGEDGKYILKSRQKMDVDEGLYCWFFFSVLFFKTKLPVLPHYRTLIAGLMRGRQLDDSGLNAVNVRMISFILATGSDKEDCRFCGGAVVFVLLTRITAFACLKSIILSNMDR
jgi:hypothetical protein